MKIVYETKERKDNYIEGKLSPIPAMSSVSKNGSYSNWGDGLAMTTSIGLKKIAKLIMEEKGGNIKIFVCVEDEINSKGKTSQHLDFLRKKGLIFNLEEVLI